METLNELLFGSLTGILTLGVLAFTVGMLIFFAALFIRKSKEPPPKE